MRVFADCRQAVTQLAFSPDGKMLAAAGEETKVRIFDLAAGAQLAELKDHSASISSLSWSTHNRHLATACSDGTLRLWDIKKLSPMRLVIFVEWKRSNLLILVMMIYFGCSTVTTVVLEAHHQLQRIVCLLSIVPASAWSTFFTAPARRSTASALKEDG